MGATLAYDAGTPQRSEDERRKQESLAAFAATSLLLVIVVAAVLLLWHPWRNNGQTDGGSSGGGGLVIGTVDGKEARADLVAIVVRKGSAVADVLARHGLSGDGGVELGDGSYLIATGGRPPAALIAELKGDAGVIDAGYVFQDPTPASTATPVPAAPDTPASPQAPAEPTAGVSPIQ